ncbi:MAG: hypothetical protein ACK47B_03310 [Armatimonadota bacterium]
MDPTPALEVAHVIPGRLRLRWKGPGEPPPDLLTGLQEVAGVDGTEYRASSRSLLVRHQNGLDLDQLSRIAEQHQVALHHPEPRPLIPPATRKRSAHPDERVAVVIEGLEVLVLVGLMVSWVRDMVVARRIKASTLLLLVLGIVNLYQLWQRRQLERREADAPAELEPIPL